MEIDREAEIDRNFTYFQGVVAGLMPKHAGKFVVVRDCHVELHFFDSSATALIEGYKKYPDGLFAVQEVVEKPLDLGFYSHVANNGAR